MVHDAIAETLRTLRLSAHVPQKKIAKALGKRVDTISRKENGHLPLTGKEIDGYLGVLGLTARDFARELTHRVGG